MDWPDPAAAPLGTDDEAGSNATTSPVRRETGPTAFALEPKPAAKDSEGPIPNTGISRFNDEYGLLITLVGLGIMLIAILFLPILLW